MYTKTWQVIKDDSKKTYEVCGNADNPNAFTNEVYGMQRVGMNVSCTTPPVSNKESSRDLVKIRDYAKEDGLYARLQKQYKDIIMSSYDEGDY